MDEQDHALAGGQAMTGAHGADLSFDERGNTCDATVDADGVDAFEIELIVRAEHGDPFATLGMHLLRNEPALAIRAFLPQASRVWAIDSRDGSCVHQLRKVHAAGFFACRIPGRAHSFPYRLQVERQDDAMEIEDPYRFPPALQDADLRLFAEGRHIRAQELLGCNRFSLLGVDGAVFSVWAPNARRVSVVGDFNDWDARRHPMRRRAEAGVWELFIPGFNAGARYKFEIKDLAGEVLPLKADPYARAMERAPSTASVVSDAAEHAWRDADWLTRRASASALDAPIAIYEVHLGSWKRSADGAYLTYAELADELAPYAQDMGFTHIELLPIAEHPFGGSWGYQPLGLFAPTVRFGAPDDFRDFVDRFHQAGIGVILDWVGGHFPSDPHGLACFDGSHLYECADPERRHQPLWSTLAYNYDCREVASYLLSNAAYWIEAFHADGLRVDAVSAMLYLDHGRLPGEWRPNKFGGRANLDALAFLRRLNETIHEHCHGVVTAAEESTDWPMVSRPTHLGGVGFRYKWNLGWVRDTLRFMARDPIDRRFHHRDLTFGLLYAFSENFILPLSHDEVVDGKGSLLSKMPGDRRQKFANLRLYLAFMYMHPGKKLLFMGGEFAQEREWSHRDGLDWRLLENRANKGVQRLVARLNRLYRRFPALHELDCDASGFEWINCDDAEQSVFSCVRFARNRREHVVVVCNFAVATQREYRIGLPTGEPLVELLDTDAQEYGGSGVREAASIQPEPVAWQGRPFSTTLTLPPLTLLVLAPAQHAA